jgi:hypothetical protein
MLVVDVLVVDVDTVEAFPFLSTTKPLWFQLRMLWDATPKSTQAGLDRLGAVTFW